MRTSIYALVLLALLYTCPSEAVLSKIIYGTLTDDTVVAQENWTGVPLLIVHRFGGMCPQNWYNWVFGEMLSNWNAGRITHFSLDPVQETWCVANPIRPADPNLYTIQGNWDNEINMFSAGLKNFLQGPDGKMNTSDDRRIYLRLAHELNGNWYPWSANTTTFKLMWRYIYNKVMNQTNATRTHVQWIFEPVAPNAAQDFRNYWPGDQYVDWLSLDAYNTKDFQTWYQPNELYDVTLFQLRAWRPALPVMISETGSYTYQVFNGTARKNQWIQDLHAYMAAQNVQVLVYFNTNDGTNDWPYFAGPTNRGITNITYNGATYSVYPGYKTSIQKYGYRRSNTSNPRILSDNEFLGRLPGYMTPPATPPNQVIYDNGASFYDWSPTPAPYPVNKTDSTVVRPGQKYSMSFTLAPWGNLQLNQVHLGFNSSFYRVIQFYAYTSVVNTKINLRTFTSASDIATYGFTIPTPNTWTFYAFNLTTIGIPYGTQVKGFYIQGASNNNQGKMYMDQVQLLPNNMTWPTSWPA